MGLFTKKKEEKKPEDKPTGKFEMKIDPVTGKKEMVLLKDKADEINRNIERPEPELKPANSIQKEESIKQPEFKLTPMEPVYYKPEGQINIPNHVPDGIDLTAQQMQERFEGSNPVLPPGIEAYAEEPVQEQPFKGVYGTIKVTLHMNNNLSYGTEVPAELFKEFIDQISVAKINRQALALEEGLIIFNLDSLDYITYE